MRILAADLNLQQTYKLITGNAYLDRKSVV